MSESEKPDPVAALEAQGADLARAGRIASPKGRTTIRTRAGGAWVSAVTQPAFHDDSEGSDSTWNADNLLVAPTTIADRPSVVLAVAEGNYKDDASYLSTMAAVCEVHAELTRPLASGADVGPALQRALLAADARIEELTSAPIGERRLVAPSTVRRSLKGIGASVVAAVAGAGFVWVAQAGENRAIVVRNGRAKRLVVPHTLAYHPGYRGSAVVTEDPWLGEVVLNILGLGGPRRIDVTRMPLEKGDRLVLGNPSLAILERPHGGPLDGDRSALVDRFLREARNEKGHLPATLLVADFETSP
jgi:hypothetical protein